MGDTQLARTRNIIGTGYTDVYSFYSTLLNNDIQSIFAFVNERLLPFLAKHPYERNRLLDFFAVDYEDATDINHFVVTDLPDSFQSAMLALALPLVEITGRFGRGVSRDKKFQVLLNKCYHLVRFTRLFAELNLPKNLFANRSAIKT